MGKSIILQDATRRFNSKGEEMVLHVDGRLYQNQLAKGVAYERAKLEANAYLKKRLTEDAWVDFWRSLDDVGRRALAVGAESAFQEAMKKAGVEESTQKSLCSHLPGKALL